MENKLLLFQEKMEALEQGAPLESCLVDLSNEEKYLLQLAVVLRDLPSDLNQKPKKRRRQRYTTFKTNIIPNDQKTRVLPLWLKPLTSLEPRLQEIVALRFLVGLPIQEVAASLNEPTDTVIYLQHNGLEALRTALGQV